MLTIHGTKHDDVLTGHAKATEVFADGGDDWLGDINRQKDKPTDDIFHGGGGDDFIFSFGGEDQLFGDGGNDEFFINSSSRHIEVDGGKGEDTAFITTTTSPELSPTYLYKNGHLVGMSFIDGQFVGLEHVEHFHIIHI